MADRPIISIITINFNNLGGLKRTVTSVLNQTCKEFEYIVIDGDSTDGSVEFLQSKDKEFDKWISEPDTGIYNAMNKGIKMARGEYLLFLNSGDELFNPNVLEENHQFLTGEDIVYFDIFLIFPDDETKIHRYPDKLEFATFRDGAIGHPTSFIKSDLFGKIGFYDEGLKIVADWKFFLMAVVKFGCSYKKVNEVLSKFYMDGISSTDYELVSLERKKVLENDFNHLLLQNEPVTFKNKVRMIKVLKWMNNLRKKWT